MQSPVLLTINSRMHFEDRTYRTLLGSTEDRLLTELALTRVDKNRPHSFAHDHGDSDQVG